MSLLAPAPTEPLYAQVLQDLETMGRTHLLVHDLAVGQLILERFWNGDAAAFHSKDPRKAMTFADFCSCCGDALQELGHSPARLGRCVRAHLVWRTLPPPAQERLTLTHLLELARCADPTLRARLAVAAVDTRWSVPRLRDAVSRANAGRWYDTDPAQPGTQPPPPPDQQGDQPRPVSAPRLVTRGEKLLAPVHAWAEGLAQADLKRLDKLQRERLRAVLAELERQVALVKKRVGRG